MAASPSIRPPASRPAGLRPRKASLLPRPLLLTLRCLVVLLVLHFEYLTFLSHTASCKFNDSPSLTGKTYNAEGDFWLDDPRWIGTKGFHVLLAADPQLLDMRSYPGRNWIARWLGVLVTDAYARKAWHFVSQSKGTGGAGADGMVWLGDLLDSGVESVDRREHSHYVHRFHLLFPLPRSPATHHTLAPPIPSILVPGNHDLGLHLPSVALASYARERFGEAFGPSNGVKEWGGWSVVWVDSMALLEPGEGGDEAREFVEQLGAKQNDLPRVLLSHIPLYRRNGTPCGPGRESSRPIQQGEGHNYQNLLDKPTSDWLLKTLAPTIVYSGDDHDSCIIEHPFRSPGSLLTSITETTLKAFSMAMGVRRPGYHLLTLYPPSHDLSATVSSGATYTQTNCLLPDQLGIWTHIYAPAFLVLLLALLLPKLLRIAMAPSTARPSSSARSNGLPVHTHSRSLSRTLFSRKPAGESDDEGADGDAQYPTFPFSPDREYHSGLEDDLPTSSYAVRRVSRVWMWEKGGSAGYGGERARWGDEVGAVVWARRTFRPLHRMVRTGWRSVWGPQVARVLGRAGSTLGGPTVVETLKQLWSIIWFGLVTWLAILIWFML